MKSLGQTLRHARERQEQDLSELSWRTSIPEPYLAALEAEKYEQLPASPYLQGYVKLLAPELHINEEALLALLRRDLPADQKKSPPKRTSFRRWHHRLISPRTISFTLLGLLFLFLTGTLLFQWRRLSQPPLLEISTPHTAEVLRSPLRIQGQADPNSSLTINTSPVSLDPKGNFSYELELLPGERVIVIQATDHRSRKSERVLFVTVEP